MDDKVKRPEKRRFVLARSTIKIWRRYQRRHHHLEPRGFFFHITKTSLLLRRCYCTTVFRLAGQSALGLATPYSPAGESTTATYVTTLSRAAELPDASTGAALLVGAGA